MAFNALGDALAAQAEAAPDPSTQEALLRRALQEGYSMALSINRQHADALVGTAEVELQTGRCAHLSHNTYEQATGMGWRSICPLLEGSRAFPVHTHIRHCC